MRTAIGFMLGVLGLVVAGVSSSGAQATASPTSQESAVSFKKDIEPILRDSCWSCHGEGLQMAALDLRTREGALKGGDNGPALVPGKADESRMYRRVAGLEEPAMPLDGMLSKEQVAAMKAWIDAGANWESDAATR